MMLMTRRIWDPGTLLPEAELLAYFATSKCLHFVLYLGRELMAQEKLVRQENQEPFSHGLIPPITDKEPLCSCPLIQHRPIHIISH